VDFFIKFAEEGIDEVDIDSDEDDVRAFAPSGEKGSKQMPVMWH
jgi:hypothetical protein